MSDENTRRELMRKTGSIAGLAALGAALGAGSAEAQTMEINAMGPTPEQMQAFMALPRHDFSKHLAQLRATTVGKDPILCTMSDFSTAVHAKQLARKPAPPTMLGSPRDQP